MAISYNNLWKILIDKKLKKTDLIPMCGISPKTIARMGKNQPVSIDVLDRICCKFDLDLKDVVELIKE